VYFCFCSYNTFSGLPPEVVKKMARKDLAEEVTLLCKGHFMHLVTKSKAVGINHVGVACRFGGCRLLWVSRQKLPSNSSRSLTAFKM